MIRFGPYYYPTGMKTEITSTFGMIDRVLWKHGVDGILSSGIDRKHGRGSLHYAGMAVDVTWEGFWDTSMETKEAARNDLAAVLGQHYDVVLENDKSHIHIEYQPKIAVNEHWR